MLNTLLIIVEQSLLHLPLIIGAYISFSLLKVPDLSIESAYVVGAIMGIYPLTHCHAIPLGIMIIIIFGASFLGGTLVGLTSSLLTQKGNFSHLLSCIITFGLFHGINQYISPVYVSLANLKNPLMFFEITNQHPEIFMLFLISLIIIGGIFFLFKTQLGYSYAVYGNNPQFFKHYGISTPFIFITGIMLANGLAGVSGYLFAQSNSFMELNMGLGKTLLCITALILGKTIITLKKPFSLLVPIVGTAAYFTLQQLLLKVGFNLKFFTATQALFVVLILLYTSYKKPQTINDSLGV
jgi:putative tryptophan/tyrosine transport system permease protein